MEKSQAKVDWLKRNSAYIFVLIWFSIIHLSDFIFEDSTSRYVFLIVFLCGLVNLIVSITRWNKLSGGQTAAFFKELALINLKLILLIGAIAAVIYFLDAAAALVPERIAAFFPVILTGVFILLFIAGGFYLVEKSIKN